MLKMEVTDIPQTFKSRRDLLLQADIESGGQLLKQFLVGLDNQLACADKKGELMALGSDGFFWEPLATTVARVAGVKVDFSNLTWSTPSQTKHVPQPKLTNISMRCAAFAGQVESTVCTYRGGHTFPFDSKDGTWMDFALHDFIWMDFMKGGNLRRL